MGNVACCKKPNELIEDKDLLKKSTIRKDIRFAGNQAAISNEENPFYRTKSKENPDLDINSNRNRNINTNTNTSNIEEENQIHDLEKNNIEKNKLENINIEKNNIESNNIESNNIENNNIENNNIERQSSMGPSDNLRKKKLKIQTQSNSQSPKNAYYSTYNTTENNKVDEMRREIQPINDNFKREQNISGNMNILNEQNLNNIKNNQQINNDIERGPMDRVKKKTNQYNNNINNNINIENKNLNNPQVKLDKTNMIEVTQNQINNKEQLFEEQNNNFVQPTNQSIEFVNNSKYFQNSTSPNVSSDNIPPQPKPQMPLEPKIQAQTLLNQNNPNDNQISAQNNELEENEIPQNSPTEKSNSNFKSQENISNFENQDIQVEGEDPQDSNEVYQKPNLKKENIDNNDNIDNNNIDDNNSKEAYIQNPDGKIYPTKQLSDNEIAILYNQCLSRGETEPDDDFTSETYKKFYQENDPFFNFDKGEINQAQIISSPDDINNLEIYEGEINENNKKHGFGICTTPFYVRKGTWRNGEFTGWGRESRRNKDVLEGKFINGKVCGKGFLKNNRGNLYIGDFINSQREGCGELYTNKIHYIGEFKNDQLNGKGIIEFLKEGHKYEGDFKNNEINGKGIFRWKNGDVYEGEMSNGKMNGHGTYKYSDGTIYDGDYVNGLREGKGRIIYSNKTVYEGEFKGGHRVEHGNIIYSRRENNDNDNENLINNKVRDNYDNNEEPPN